MRKINAGILGATGQVGRELIRVLKDRDFPLKSLRLYASERSAGKVKVDGMIIENANNADYSELDIAFFVIDSDWSKENALKALNAECIVIDNSSAFRYDDDIPLIIPEINPRAIDRSRLFPNPNCTTAIAALPLWEIYKNFGLKKVRISTYQSASGAGNGGMNELEEQTYNYLEGREVKNEIFQYPIPFNLVPHIDVFQDNGYSKEEMKVVWEIRKIFGDKNIPISCTCVRVPIKRVHSESIVAETNKKVDLGEVVRLFEKAPGIEVRDDPDNDIYPMPLTAEGKYDVEVGRIRKDLICGDYGLEFFVSGDQLLKGAALNAVQIGELIVKKGL